ncbi:M16 family metallopeptidase [Massilia sp. TSP1-1-2]|uniref:M16 family metallopeptidase n=1 Tax=unclassified Massilia TaxID=2609279 RepID=UPI003CF40871
MKKLMLTLAVSMLFTPVAYSANNAVDNAADTAAAASALPPYGKDKPIPPPQIHKKTLANGMTIWVVPRQGLPRVDMLLAVRGSGFTADDKQHPGFATMLAGLFNEGTAKRDSRAIAEAAQGMGGAVAAFASNDGISVQASSLASNGAAMMQLLAEVTRTPSFPANEVELAKANALEGLKASETQPGFRAERALSQAVYGEHPYGSTMPTAEAITTVTPQYLRAEHARRIRPDRTLLVITGRVTEAEAMKMATAAFGDWKAQGAGVPETPGASLNAKPVRVVLARAGSVQSTVRLGSPAISATGADLVPLRLASTIIGGGFSSRLNTSLREEKGYTYGASAGGRTYRNGGAIMGGADVRNEVTGAAIKEFFNEYRRLGTDLVPPSELVMNKRYVAGGYLLSNQLQRAVAGTLASNWLIGLPPEFLGQFVPMIQKVTPEQVREMGKKYFVPENQSVIVVGDPAAITAQLKEVGEFVVSDK